MNFQIADLSEEVKRLKSRGASDVDNLLKKLNEKIEENENLRRELDENETNYQTVLSKIKETEEKLKRVEQEKRTKEEENHKLKEDLDNAESRIRGFEKRVKSLEGEVVEG